jgi:transcriptional regulator with XRE-family HTH domain
VIQTPKHIGKELERARKHLSDLGVTAGRIAKRCNVSRSRLYQWERQTFILPKNLRALAMALGIPHSVLVALNGPRPPSKKPPAVQN